MKKSLNMLLFCAISASALITPVAEAKMGPQRWAKCTFQPNKYGCTEAERKEARKWLARAGAAVTAAAAAAAAALGIALSIAQVQTMQKDAQDEVGSQAISPKAQTYADNFDRAPFASYASITRVIGRHAGNSANLNKLKGHLQEAHGVVNTAQAKQYIEDAIDQIDKEISNASRMSASTF